MHTLAYNQYIEVNVMNEKAIDRQLQIKTTGVREWLTESVHHNRYEATPYNALEELFAEYTFQKDDVLVDFGCGKGRLPFYVHNRFNIAVAGIEVSDILYQKALHNLANYTRNHKKGTSTIRFECCLAEKYTIRETDNRFYFFNPFSYEIFFTVIRNIIQSVETNPREVEVILYYPTPEYMFNMEEDSPFELIQEIIVKNLQQPDPHDRFVVFKLNPTT